MPEYLAPGVYVEERDVGPPPIEGVSTSTAGFVGLAARGPTTGRPQLVTSFAEFERRYGGHFMPGANTVRYRYLPFAVEGFFNNGGRRAYIMRAAPAGLATASAATSGGFITRLLEDQSSATPTKAKLVSLRGIDAAPTALTFTQVKDGVTTTANVNVTAYDPTTNEVTVNNNLPAGLLAAYTTVAVAGRPGSLTLEAREQGTWGSAIVVTSAHAKGARSAVTARLSTTQLTLASTVGFYPNAYVEIDTGTTKTIRKVASVDGLSITTSAHGIPTPLPAGITVEVCEFDLTVSYGGVTEAFRGLTLESGTGRYVVDALANGSTLVQVRSGTVPGTTSPDRFPTGDDGLHLGPLAGGNDGNAPDANTFIGHDNGPSDRTGLHALKSIDGINIIAVPGVTNRDVQQAMITQCERLKYRFAVLDTGPIVPPAGGGALPADTAQTLDLLRTQRSSFDTRYAAMYFPRLMALDPLNPAGPYIPIPPSGHMMGIYARTDNNRGVHKAPANEVVGGISDVEQIISFGDQEVINVPPIQVNVVRDFREQGRAIRVWGARCITSDADWKYVNVRRLFIFLEASIDRGTQWVVFEPNAEPLWARVTQSVANFLTGVWRDGALMGTKPEEAFFIRCDRSTMSQDDLDNGRLIMLIGVAPVKPAEFVVIRISQWAGPAATA